MDEAKQELVQTWLRRAYTDLLSARRLSEEPGLIFITALYHCQQCAEKAIKRFLVFHDQPFEKTHDVDALLRLAIPINRSLSDLVGAANRITEYAVVYRYPSDEPEPDRSQFTPVLRQVEEIYSRLLQVLPGTVHP
jgi:HEPN domain-containing protein